LLTWYCLCNVNHFFLYLQLSEDVSMDTFITGLNLVRDDAKHLLNCERPIKQVHNNAGFSRKSLKLHIDYCNYVTLNKETCGH
jgi:hypothetical protein